MEKHTLKLSVDSGSTSVPLLEETIPQNLARTVAEHGERDALVSVEQGLRTDSFPMTITGKIQKFKMRETSIAELDLGDAEAHSA